MASFFDIMYEPPIKLFGDEKYPLFKRISIETISFCNRACSFCPVAWSDRGATHMSQTLYDKIVAELGQLEFAGVVQMFLLNEPTIDNTMIAKLNQISAACPKATFYASSNGDVFDTIWRTKGIAEALERVRSYFDAGLTVLNLNVYDKGTEQFDRFAELHRHIISAGIAENTENRYRKHPRKRKFVALTDMRVEERTEIKGTDLLYIRNKHERDKMTQVPQRHCSRSQNHVVVLFNGKVPICCAIDPTDDELPTMGDVNQRSLVDIWNDEPMFRYRYYTQNARRVLPGCSTCTHRMAYPHVVRPVTADDAYVKRWDAIIEGEEEARKEKNLGT